ncbi:hypothetical protein [Enterococcus gilvus]|uniref:hypothetical protein n=1 Tax=Enterococcus gilvus TaxID=160453 RepID=UPI003EDB6581
MGIGGGRKWSVQDPFEVPLHELFRFFAKCFPKTSDKKGVKVSKENEKLISVKECVLFKINPCVMLGAGAKLG